MAMLLLGGFMIERLFAVRSGMRVFKGIMKEVKNSPVFQKLRELNDNPRMEKFGKETMESIKIFNELMKKVKKDGLAKLLLGGENDD